MIPFNNFHEKSAFTINDNNAKILFVKKGEFYLFFKVTFVGISLKKLEEGEDGAEKGWRWKRQGEWEGKNREGEDGERLCSFNNSLKNMDLESWILTNFDIARIPAVIKVRLTDDEYPV